MLTETLGCSGLGIEIEGREREGSFGSSFFGGGGVTTLGFSGVGTGKLNLGREILGISNVGLCCWGCLGGVGGTGFFSASGMFGSDNEGNENLASGGGRKDFFGSEGNVSTGGGLGISALGSDLTPNDSDSYG